MSLKEKLANERKDSPKARPMAEVAPPTVTPDEDEDTRCSCEKTSGREHEGASDHYSDCDMDLNMIGRLKPRPSTEIAFCGVGQIKISQVSRYDGTNQEVEFPVSDLPWVVSALKCAMSGSEIVNPAVKAPTAFQRAFLSDFAQHMLENFCGDEAQDDFNFVHERAGFPELIKAFALGYIRSAHAKSPDRSACPSDFDFSGVR